MLDEGDPMHQCHQEEGEPWPISTEQAEQIEGERHEQHRQEHDPSHHGVFHPPPCTPRIGCIERETDHTEGTQHQRGRSEKLVQRKRHERHQEVIGGIPLRMERQHIL